MIEWNVSELAKPRIHTDNKHIDHRGSVSNKPGGFLEDSSPFYTLKFVQIVILMMQIVSCSSRSLSLLFFISTDFQASSTVLDQFWLHGRKHVDKQSMTTQKNAYKGEKTKHDNYTQSRGG